MKWFVIYVWCVFISVYTLLSLVVILPCVVQILLGAIIHSFVCLHVCLLVRVGIAVVMHVCFLSVCVWVYIVPWWLFPCCTDACSGDSIVSMSKDLPAALFRRVFIMLIQRKEGTRGGGMEEATEGTAKDNSTRRKEGVFPSCLHFHLCVLPISFVLALPLYFPFFLSMHPLHLPLSYLQPYFFDNPSKHCLHNYTQQWFPSSQEKCVRCLENIL